MRELYIEEVKPDLEQKGVEYKIIKRFYDTVHEIRVVKIKLNKQLEVGKIYAFNYIDYNSDDTYHYIVLKQEDSDIYYIAEYYGKLITTKESHLVEGAWTKINIEELDINLSRYNV